MKLVRIFILLIFVPLFSFGQTSILVTHTIPYSHASWVDHSKHVIENYYVLANDTSKKDGTYSLRKLNNAPLVIGTYTNGIKTGVWNYYNYETDELFEQYNYDTKRDVLYNSFPKLALVKSKKGFVLDSIDSAPHLPGEEGFFFVLNQVKFPAKAMDAGISGIVYITIELDTAGIFTIDSISYSPMIVSSGYSDLFKKSIEAALISLPRYIPAEDDGKRVIFKMEKFPVKFFLQ